MRRALLLAAGLLGGPVAAAPPPEAPAAPPPTAPPAPPPVATANGAQKPKRQLVAVVLPQTRRVVGYPKVKAYLSPSLAEEPPLEPSEVRTVEVTEKDEALVLVRPYGGAPLLGSAVSGARLSVRGVVHSKSAYACASRVWYALDPFGYLCQRSVRPSAEPADGEPLLKVPEGQRLPFRYVMVGIKEGTQLPMWGSLDDASAGGAPERQLEKGDTVAVQRTVKVDGIPHYVSVEGKVLPVKGTFAVGDGSPWAGEALDDKTLFPFGWVTPEQAKVYGTAEGGQAIELLARRSRVAILEEAGEGRRRMLRVGDGRWLRAGDVNEVRKLPRPAGITPAKPWLDVDLGEQVLVAYEDERPVFATLVSSGRAIPTPRGDYPIWAKVTAINMKSQPYEDKAYFVNKVPWVLFFQAHNAIHGAYWHDRFGVSKSHGCINVSPLDARRLFAWVQPALPPGWSGYRPVDLMASPTVHIRNSHQKRELVQERPIGPPDKELEAMKLVEAEERRAATVGDSGAAAAPSP